VKVKDEIGPPRRGLVHVTAPSGHRQSYLDLFERLLRLQPSVGGLSRGNLVRLLSADRVLFATIDDDIRLFALVCLLRAVMRRRTVGVFLRPQSCLGKTAKARIKHALFGLLRRCPGVTTLSIIPFELMAGQERVVRGWIHDPQLWDQIDIPDHPDSHTVVDLRALAGERPVLAFLGTVTQIKGIGFLAEILALRPDLAQQYCIIIGGEVAEACRSDVKQLVDLGATVWDRRLTDAEMSAVYEAASLVWACYDPSYDQASGIFGRAVQRGRMAVIREGALLGRYAEILGHPYIALPYDPHAAAERLTSIQIVPVPKSPALAGWRAQSIAAIRSAL